MLVTLLSDRILPRHMPQLLFDKLAIVWLIAEKMEAPSVYHSALAGCVRLYPAESNHELHKEVLQTEPFVRKAADAIVEARFRRDEAAQADLYFSVLKELTLVVQNDARIRNKGLPPALTRLWRPRRATGLTRVQLCERHLADAVRQLLTKQLSEIVADHDRQQRLKTLQPFSS